MKKLVYILLLLITVSACDEEFLERKPLNQISSESVFEDESLSDAYLNNLQGRLPYGYNGRSEGYAHYVCMIASITDEARAKSGWVVNNKIVIKGAISPTNSGNLGLWSTNYKTIREANNIIEGLGQSATLSEEYKALASAKAKYVRAFAYFDLARRYGDVPLIKHAQSVEDDLLVSRTPRAEVYNFIYDELVEAAKSLPNKSEVPAGSINKQAAVALNARVMLYAQKWEKSASLADQIITGSLNDGIDLNPDYRTFHLSKGGDNEAIMEKITLPPITGHGFGLYNWPVRWRSDWGGQTNPTQQLVDSYEMAVTGLPITDAASGYNPERPYDGRDSRFYASIFYHGSEFSEVAPSSGEPFIDMEWNNYNEGPGEKHHGAASITGYLVKKFADPSDGFGPKDKQSTVSWKELGYAELLLNYAEAANEHSGPSEKVYNAVNKIRNRAGLPNLPAGLSKDEMRERIRHERKIELVFENHRYFDLIRWGIAIDVLNGFEPIGIKIERKATAPSHEEKPQLFDPEMFTFTKFVVPGRTQTFPESNMLLPIPQSELDKNPNLTQNPGYN